MPSPPLHLSFVPLQPGRRPRPSTPHECSSFVCHGTFLVIAYLFGPYISLPELPQCVPLTGWFKQKKCVFLQFWKLEVQDQGAIASVSGEAFLSGLWMATFSLCSHMAFPLCMHGEGSLWYLFLILQGHQSYEARASPL